MVKRVWLTFVVFMLITSLAACSSPEEEVLGSKGVFYEVAGGSSQAYLFGAIHVGTEEMYPLDHTVDEAFSQSDVLVLEVDIVNTSMVEVGLELLNFAKLDDGRKMSDIVPADLFSQLVNLVAPLGLGGEFLDQFQPWYGELLLENLVIQQSGLSPDYGVENYFIERAADMEVMGLETVQDQLSPYMLLSDESQILNLENTIDQLSGAGDEIYQIIDYWQDGNIDGFAAMREETLEDAPRESLEAFHRAMLDERDEKMAVAIEELLEDDSGNVYFVVVGALHLVGENSIVDLLRENGYEVEVAGR